MTMSEGVAVEGGISRGFLLGNESWANLLVNSDNSGGGSEEDKDLGKKDGTEVMGVSPVGQDQAQAQAVGHQPAPENKKWKVGGGGGGKNGMEVEDKGKVTVNGGGGGGESDEHEMHIWTERERRKKMRNMFANLHALLPHLPDKADKSTIVDEAVNYIKVLQQTHQKLQKQKLEMLQGATIVNFDPSLLNQKNVVFESREAFLANHGSSNNLASLISSTSTTPCSGSNLVSNSRFVPANFETLSSPNVVLNMCGEEAQICVCSPKKPGLFANICYIMDKYNIGVVSANISSDCNRSMYMIQAHAMAAPDLYLDTFPAEEIFKQAAGEISVMASS